MDTELILTLQRGLIWDERVVGDLFLGGVGVGAFLFAFLLWRFAEERYLPLVKVAATIAPVSVAAGLGLLFWKLGNKLNVYQLILNVSPTSVMWWGAIIQGAFVALSALFAFRLLFPHVSLPRVLSASVAGVLGVPFAVAVGIYHGLLLAVLTSHPLWASGPMIVTSVLLFTITGVAASLLVYLLLRAFVRLEAGPSDVFAQGLKPVALVLIAAAALLLVTLFAWFVDLRFGPLPARLALQAMLSEYGVILAVFGIGFGLLVPIVVGILLLPRFGAGRTPPAGLVAIACLLLLAGGFTIRYAAVIGGQLPTPLSVMATLS